MSSEQLSMFANDDEARPASGRTSGFTITRTFKAPAQKVCDQWLLPVFLENWMFTTDKIVELNNQVRRGGNFSYRINRRGKEVEFSGEYIVLDIPRSIQCSWRSSADPDRESLITLQFTPVADKTRMVLSMKLPAEMAEERNEMKREWTSRCKALAQRFK